MMYTQYFKSKSFSFNFAVFIASFLVSLLAPSPAQTQSVSITDNVLSIPVVAVGDLFFRVDLTIVADTDPAELELNNAVALSDATAAGASSFDGSNLSIPSIMLGDLAYRAELTLIGDSPVRFRLVSAELIASSQTPPPPACTREESDRSHNLDKPPIIAGATVPLADIFDGGSGPDGIPPLEAPLFIDDLNSVLNPEELVIGVKIGNDVRAYSHNIMDWHEIVNERFMIDDSMENTTLSYCPLTGSAMFWRRRRR